MYYVSKEVGGLGSEKLHFLLIFSTINAYEGGWLGPEKAKTC